MRRWRAHSVLFAAACAISCQADGPEEPRTRARFGGPTSDFPRPDDGQSPWDGDEQPPPPAVNVPSSGGAGSPSGALDMTPRTEGEHDPSDEEASGAADAGAALDAAGSADAAADDGGANGDGAAAEAAADVGPEGDALASAPPAAAE